VVGLEADDGRWSAHLFVKNVLDDFYVDLKTQRSNRTIYHYLANYRIGAKDRDNR
jgi:hypothetical protein